MSLSINLYNTEQKTNRPATEHQIFVTLCDYTSKLKMSQEVSVARAVDVFGHCRALTVIKNPVFQSSSVTRNQDKLFIPPGGIDFSPQTDKPGVVDIYLRAGDNTPGTGLHWHETYTEYLQVVQGYALVTVGDRTAVFSKDDGIITIPRYTIHQYMRADKTDEGKAGKDVDLIVREWTEPGDGDKEVFFRNMISLIIDKKDGALGTMGMLLSVMTVCWSHDNYPVFWKGPEVVGEAVQQRVRRALTFSLMGCLVLFGRLVGYRPQYPEYTP